MVELPTKRQPGELEDRGGGKRRPLTLRELRERVMRDEPIDALEWGGCGCMTDAADLHADD